MESISDQDAAKLREIEREMNRPSPRFIRTVGEVAQKLGLDAQRMAAGEPVTIRSMVFQALHHGQSQPDALTLIIRMGLVPQAQEAAFLRHLLEHNVVMPSYMRGVYGLLPGTDIVVMRIRVEPAKAASAAKEALQYIEAFAAQFDAVVSMMKVQAELGKLVA